MFRQYRLFLILALLLTTYCSVRALPEGGESDYKGVFALLDLNRPGLEKVKQCCEKGDYGQASKALLNYYRSRKGVVNPDIDLNNISVSKREQKWADDALEHTFYVHDGYQPSFNYGKDINWKYWPVKDNELRWQLHRHKWFTPMGKVYQKTKDERYAKEWMLQYSDWIAKNPMAEVTKDQYEMDAKIKDEIIENAAFAWRPLETSHRVQDQINQFTLFLSSPNFTPEFLLEFLQNYYNHANHIMHNFSEKGNHLLFEAQRVFYAGTFFPEFKDAPAWQKRGIDILNREIGKQVYDDGGQFELDPHYHLASINIFCRAIAVAKANHVEQLIPQSYINTVEKMIDFYANICYPDYTNPCFSDAKLGDPKAELKNFREWSKIFPQNETIKYLATKGKQGTMPKHLSKGFLTSGFFTFRNGWGMDATVMVVKAGPKGEWHCQPDNGTFELWFHGKKLFPDSGSYIYGGDKEVLKMRDWFRQTTVHNTLTLDHKNIETTESKTLLWKPNGAVQTLVTENPSYRDLRHRRTVFFVDNRFFVLVDEALGKATGTVNLNYHLTDGKIDADRDHLKVTTQYDDNRNVSIQGFSDQKAALEITEGWYSKAYRQKTARPSLSFDLNKANESPVRFVTVITPFAGTDKKENVQAKILKATDSELQVEIKVNGKKQVLSWTR